MQKYPPERKRISSIRSNFHIKERMANKAQLW